MKDKLGIKVSCANCKHCTDNGNGCGLIEMPNDGIFGTRHCAFSPSKEAYETRIKYMQKVMCEEADAIDLGVSALNKHYEEQIQRLKKQVFTWDELNLIRNIIIEVKRVNHLRYYGFHPTPLLNKIERILNNEK